MWAATTGTTSSPTLLADVRAGRPRAVGRVISLVENGSARLPQIMADLAPDTGRAYVVGITGAPGVGKSSITAALVTHLRRAGRRVGVLAVDPSSPYSGGAVLGDRVRMQQHGLDSGVYIRSMATRGHLGGLSVAAPHALRVFDAAGLDVVLVETVGVGQSEVEVAQVADVTVVLLAPGMGDAVQAAKAGLLETADLYVVNKADRDGAGAVVRDLRAMVALGDAAAWSPPVLTTVAVDDQGIDELWAGVERFADRPTALRGRRGPAPGPAPPGAGESEPRPYPGPVAGRRPGGGGGAGRAGQPG